MNIGHNSECRTCNGLGGWIARQADCFRDEKSFHETPREVIQALAESQTGFAYVACPDCGGTGEIGRQP